MLSDKAQAQALRLIEIRRYADAKKILTEALRNDIDNDYLFQLLAVCEKNLNNQNAARNALQLVCFGLLFSFRAIGWWFSIQSPPVRPRPIAYALPI